MEEELKEILKALGSPEDIRERNKKIDALHDEKEKRDWLFRGIGIIARWVAAVGTAYLLVKSGVAAFLLNNGSG